MLVPAIDAEEMARELFYHILATSLVGGIYASLASALLPKPGGLPSSWQYNSSEAIIGKACTAFDAQSGEMQCD